MNAVILCAGFATRMYPLTKNFPKPLLEVAGKPVIDYLMEQIIALAEIKSVHIISNAKFFHHFTHWYSKRRQEGLFGKISIEIHNDGSVDNESRLGAAGDLLLALQKIDRPSRILVSGGDNIYRFSIKPLWETFLENNNHCIPTLFETELKQLQKTGILEIGKNDRVIRLHEKPAKPPSTWTSPPLYFFEPSVRSVLENFLKTEGNHDAPGYFIDYLCRQETVQAIKLNSTRLDIGSVQSYHQADRVLRQTPPDWD